jgi:uncharacterized protein YndB with AHSA1/START domain
MSCQNYDATTLIAGVAHGNFTLERTYPVPPARAFAAWAKADLKARWFVGPDGWDAIRRELDFRVGGQEVLHGRIEAMETLFTARYHDIVPDQRIVYDYDMHLNGNHHSVSVAAVEFRPEGTGTKLVFTEHVVFLDGTDGVQGTASREHGTAAHLDRLMRTV